jgi:hypothetical protein
MLDPPPGPGAGADPAGAAYIRGSGGVVLRTGRLRRILVIAALLILAGVTAGSTLHELRTGLLVDRLRTRGQAVVVTVTQCRGLASGTGITAVGYVCSGSFTIGPAQHVSDIGGVSDLLPTGTPVAGVVDPGRPATLYTRQWVLAAPSLGHDLMIPGLLAALLLVVALLAWPWTRRS